MRIKKPNIDEIKKYKREQLQSQIREVYSVDEEFRILNLGIVNAKDKEFLKYRKTINSLVLNYKQETGEIYERGNRD
jgi:hypothetical protein